MHQRRRRIRHTFVANLRKRSEVSWPNFLIEMAIVALLNVAFAGVLLVVGAASAVPPLTIVCVGYILGFTALRLVLRAVFSRDRRQD
jgi:Flp pilus assembly protein TadB